MNLNTKINIFYEILAQNTHASYFTLLPLAESSLSITKHTLKRWRCISHITSHQKPSKIFLNIKFFKQLLLVLLTFHFHHHLLLLHTNQYPYVVSILFLIDHKTAR